MRKNGQILVITLLVLTILSILTVSLIVLNNRDVNQTVNREAYEKIYNSSETKLKEVLGVVADPDVQLSVLPTQYAGSCLNPDGSSTSCSCINLGGSIEKYECNFVLPSSTPPITYSNKLTISNEKDIVDYTLNKDRPLSISLNGYSSYLDITINKTAALDFTLIYEQGSVLKSFSGVYDPSLSAYSSTDASTSTPVFNSYISGGPLSFRLTFPASLNAFKLLNITPRLRSSDNLLITIKANASLLATYPAQIRQFYSESYSTSDTDSPGVKIITQIPLQPQLDGLLDYSLLTKGTVKVNN